MKNKKGFTLIEIIVVLIIIAILAAIAVPAMMKYINDAKEKQIIAEMRTVYIAAQTALTEAYARDEDMSDVFRAYGSNISAIDRSSKEINCQNNNDVWKRIIELAPIADEKKYIDYPDYSLFSVYGTLDSGVEGVLYTIEDTNEYLYFEPGIAIVRGSYGP